LKPLILMLAIPARPLVAQLRTTAPDMSACFLRFERAKVFGGGEKHRVVPVLSVSKEEDGYDSYHRS
jgi:hypothetical protein